MLRRTAAIRAPINIQRLSATFPTAAATRSSTLVPAYRSAGAFTFAARPRTSMCGAATAYTINSAFNTAQCRFFSMGAPTQASLMRASGSGPNAAEGQKSGGNNAIQGVHSVSEYKEEEQQKHEEEAKEDEKAGAYDAGYLPFPPPFHTINIMSLLLLGNILSYGLMNYYNNDDFRDWMIEHFTLSHENWWKVYPMFTNAFYQENLFQLLIDGWLLVSFANKMIAFLGTRRLAVFWAMCTVGGGLIHIAKQKTELAYDVDPVEVRGRVYGPNTFILGMVGLEGLIFRHLNFMQSPPVPFLVLTAGVMIIDVWRIFTMKPEEHGSATGGALIAYLMWALPTKLFGLNKLTAAM
jgi:membrane associated rhomboid family serine protease